MKKIRLTLFMGLLFSGALAVPAQSTVPETDFQIWNETVFAFPLVKETDAKGNESDKLTLNLITSLRLGQNRLAPVDERIGAGLDLKLNSSFAVGSSYLYIAGQPGRGRNEYEHRLRFELNYEKKWKRFSIRDRNRVEYRIRHSRQDSVRYRNRIMGRVSVRSGDKEIFTPFVSTEPYYDFTAERWTRNDLTAGVSRKLNSYTSADLFYVWRHNFTGRPVNINGIGVNLKFRID